ncbi:MAG: hypothetical protein IT463_12875 [Planctomycetes bacterium]|nr:hypothetical protein [Planctomycetota bacterium]
MRYAFLLLLAVLPSFALAQSITLVSPVQPPTGPVATGASNHLLLRFRLYRATGDPTCNLTQLKLNFDPDKTAVPAVESTAIAGTDWTQVELHQDVDHSGTLNAGDTLLQTANTTVSTATDEKATLSGLSVAIPEGAANAADFVVVVDVAVGATVGRTIVVTVDNADMVVSAGTVSSTPSDPISGVHTIKTDNGCEIDVRDGSTSLVGGALSQHNIGYIDPTVIPGVNKGFTIYNIGTGSLDLTNSPNFVQISSAVQCTVTVTVQPSGSIASSGSSGFTVQSKPVAGVLFSFVISIASNDFDEDPFTVAIVGASYQVPVMRVEYPGTTYVADGGSISEGSKTAPNNVTMNFTIRNSGTASLGLTNSPDYVEVTNPVNVQASVTVQPGFTIGVGATTAFTVVYHPLGGGAFSFKLQIFNNDPYANPYNINISGTAPAITGTKLTVWRNAVAPNAGSLFSTQPIVAITDAAGAVDTSNNSTQVQGAITGGTGATGAVLSGTTTRTAVGGYVNFTNLAIDLQGTGYTLTFTDLGPSSFPAVVSVSFDVGPPITPPAPPPSNKKSSDDGGGCSGAGSVLLPWALLGVGLLSRRRRRTAG